MPNSIQIIIWQLAYLSNSIQQYDWLVCGDPNAHVDNHWEKPLTIGYQIPRMGSYWLATWE